jgi:hypothetical protein
MIKEFEKVWKIFQKEWFHAAPGHRPHIDDFIRKYFHLKGLLPDVILPQLG